MRGATPSLPDMPSCKASTGQLDFYYRCYVCIVVSVVWLVLGHGVCSCSKWTSGWIVYVWNELEQNRCLGRIHIVLMDTEITITPNMDPAKSKSCGNSTVASASLCSPPPPDEFGHSKCQLVCTHYCHLLLLPFLIAAADCRHTHNEGIAKVGLFFFLFSFLTQPARC